jgi:predicted amidohydrolase
LVSEPSRQHARFRDFVGRSIDIEGPETSAIGELARDIGVAISIGVSERSPYSVGAIYNSNLIFDARGTLISHRRKLVPTWAERLVWSNGDAFDLKTVTVEDASVGVLICGENTNPLARFALIAGAETVHISSWPPGWPFRIQDEPNSDYLDWIRLRVSAHAFEAKAFGLAAGSILGDEYLDELCGDDRNLFRILKNNLQSASFGVDPTGRVISDILLDKEGIVVFEVNTDTCVEEKLAHDVAGGYQRFDLFRLRIDRRRTQPVLSVES